MDDSEMASIPKIIRVRNIIHKDNSTLVWLKDQDTSLKQWSRWDAIVTSTADYLKWKDCANIVAIVLENLSEDDKNILERDVFQIKKSPSVFLYEQALYSQQADYWNDKPKVYLLKTILKDSPYVKPEWNGSLQDAVACLTIYNRYKRLVDCPGTNAEREETMRYMGISLEMNITPPAICLMTQYFIHKNAKRAKEIRKCLEKNCENTLIDSIILLNEEDYSKEWANMKGAEKIQQIVVGKRLTYAMFLEHTYKSVPYNTIVAFANADIYLDSSILGLYTIKMEDRMLALLRWDTDLYGAEPKLFGPHPDSQDTWIVLSDSVKTRKWDYSQFDYTLGRAGCDNRFTFDMFKNRFVIFNPSHSIKTLHIHASDIRNYSKNDIIPSTHYIYSYPGPILEYNQVTICEQAPIETFKDVPITINIQSANEKNGTTWCTMVARNGKYKWTYGTPETITNKRTIYSWKNCCLINSGVVFNNDKIYLGPDFFEFNENSNTWKDIDYYGKKSTCEKVFAIPVAQREVFENLDLYLLYYMSKAYNLLETHPSAYFWIPESFGEEMKQFSSSTSTMHCIPWDFKSTIHADEVIGYYPSNQPIIFNDIYQIRAHKMGYVYSCVPNTCIILASNLASPVDKDFAEKVRACLGDAWIVTVVDSTASGTSAYNLLFGQSLCIFFGGPKTQTTWAKLWALPQSAKVIEFQNELKVDGDFQHFAGCAKLDSWIITLNKGGVDQMRDQAVKQFQAWKVRVLDTQ